MDACEWGVGGADDGVAFAQGGAGAGGDGQAGRADRGFGHAHAGGPVGPVGAVVEEDPEDAVVGVVGGGCADLAEEFAHGSALAGGVDAAEFGGALAVGQWSARPEDATGVAVADHFVGVGDASVAGEVDHGRRFGDFVAPGRDVGDVRVSGRGHGYLASAVLRRSLWRSFPVGVWKWFRSQRREVMVSV